VIAQSVGAPDVAEQRATPVTTALCGPFRHGIIWRNIVDYNYQKPKQVRLRDVGKDEKWLQEQIKKDASILGLGDLSIIERERKQITGGRIDFLMYNPEDGVRYEIEVMLGKVDESHIIRTIEYWDIERRRFQSLEHRAVIVAEEITNRFFNIINILNRSIPIIAIQLNVTTYENNLFLNFIKVLDINEPADEEEQGTAEQVDRKYWEQRANIKSLQVFDEIINLLKPNISDLRITYNRNHIALGTTGNNFSWFHPRKGSHIHFDIKIEDDDVREWVGKLEEVGIESRLRSNGKLISIVITTKEVNENKEIINNVYKKADELSRE